MTTDRLIQLEEQNIYRGDNLIAIIEQDLATHGDESNWAPIVEKLDLLDLETMTISLQEDIFYKITFDSIINDIELMTFDEIDEIIERLEV